MAIASLSNRILLVPGGAPPVSSWHPTYAFEFSDWERWRYAYEGGRVFVEKYLKRLSDLESDDSYDDRKEIAYPPTFAKAAINDIKNSIFQRTADVTRVNGPPTYQEAMKGLEGGVDLDGNSMGSFVGTELLPELLVLAKVGILIDAPSDIGTTMRDKKGKRPYLSVYTRENIVNWAPNKPTNGFTSLLLREIEDEVDDFGLPTGQKTVWRLYRKIQSGVLVTFFDSSGKQMEEIFLDLPKIPFVVFETPLSLMEDVADYQIALLNLESSDISFARKANYPIYYEYFHPQSELPFGKPAAKASDDGSGATNKSKDREIKVGMADGRKIAKGLDKPGFVNPDPDVLRVSMEKGTQLKEDIRLLVNLNLINMNPRRQAADSKAMDAHSLEASLSFIGLVLQKGEMEIGEHWDNFERTNSRPTITYPKSYNLKTEEDRQNEAERLEKLQNKIPSSTYRRSVAKKIAHLTMFELSDKELQIIDTEIDEADTLTSDPDIILKSHKSGLVDDKRAAVALGYPEDSIEQAKKDRAERIRLTLEAQGGPQGASEARGANEFGGKTSVDEKVDKQTRGAADKIG